jgi:hypothetical protein
VRLRFNEAKATEAAARLIALRGGKMSYMKLIKLLYLADREALLRWGRPITTDRYVSMDHGPVVSNVYELIRAEPQPGRGQSWRRFVSAPDGEYDVSLLAIPEPAELSQAEDLLLREVFTLHGGDSFLMTGSGGFGKAHLWIAVTEPRQDSSQIAIESLPTLRYDRDQTVRPSPDSSSSASFCRGAG